MVKSINTAALQLANVHKTEIRIVHHFSKILSTAEHVTNEKR